MRFLACAALAIILPCLSCREGRADPDPASLTALMGELSSGDFKARRAAADKIFEAGYLTVERAARRASTLDDASFETFADAFIRCDRRAYSIALVAAAHAAPEAHRRRLLDLARHLNPKAGSTPPTPQELAAIVHHELIEVRICDEESFESETAIFGHGGVPPTLRILREEDPDKVDLWRAGVILWSNAQPEDVPAMRSLLLQGRSSVAGALHRLDALGFTEASEALFDGVRAGRFDARIADALGRMADRSRAAGVMRDWLAARGPGLTGGERCWAAEVFAALESRTDAATLEGWTTEAFNWTILLYLGKALTKLGSARGIEVLVQIVEKEPADSTPADAPEPTGRLRAEGKRTWQRASALRAISELAEELSRSKGGCACCREPLPWAEIRPSDSEMDRIGALVRTWWETSRDKVKFDEQAGAWRIESD